ncbi:MAG TPA: ADOP family duplicated permease [Gemmatimonadaceae bacterium]
MPTSLYNDFRLALRQFRRAPGSAVFIVITLAIGIGANVTMAGLIDRLLLRPPAELRDPPALRRLLMQVPGAPEIGRFVSYPVLLDLQRGVDALEGVAAYSSTRLTLGSGPQAPEIVALLVTASYFTVLGAQPVAGRAFTQSDGFPNGMTVGGPPLAVIAYELWQNKFGADPSILGRHLQIGKSLYTVIGIAPPGFRGVDVERSDVWLPITVAADEIQRFALEDRSMSWLRVVARLRPGVTPADVEAKATSIMRRNEPDAAPYNAMRVIAASVIVGRGPDAPREVKVALWLGGISALVLLIACSNVANLLMAGAFARRREIATRLALGASRRRVAQQLLAESALLATAGGVAAIVLSTAASGILRRVFLTADDGGRFVDRRVFAFTAAIALGTALLVSLVPLLQSTAPDLSNALRGGATQESPRSARVRTALLGIQAALCVLLLVVAGLFARSFSRVAALDLGMNPDHILSARFDFDHAAMSRDSSNATFSELRQRVQAIPGVRRVAYAGGTGGRAVNVHTKTQGVTEVVRRTWDVPYETPVESTYFRVLGSSMRGRDFTSADVKGAPNVTIINEPLAKLLFPQRDALGQCIYLPVRANDPDGECWTVVGVLRGFWYRRSILKREGLLVYVPMAQRVYGLGRPRQLLVATDGPASAVAGAVRAAIRSVSPDLPELSIRVMRDEIEPEIRPWRLGATMFSVFGVIALVIAGIGLYAVVSFTAAQRATEIAIRVAMGARIRDVLSAVATTGLRSVGVGLGVGISASLFIRKWIGALLFQTSPSDPGIILGVGALLFVVAALAVTVPTLRLLRQNPATLLRN